MIVEQYLQTLIPSDPQFSPSPEQTARFLERLLELGAAPLNATLLLLKPSGRLRSFKHPVTGETKTFRENDRVPLIDIGEIVAAIGTLQEYSAIWQGDGPPSLPPCALYCGDTLFTENYSFSVACCLREETVSMSDVGDEPGMEVPPFGERCSLRNRTGLFLNPVTNEVIQVENAGCARFWVEFEFGRWLFPEIRKSLDVLDPAIPALARESFGLRFQQGVHHY